MNEYQTTLREMLIISIEGLEEVDRQLLEDGMNPELLAERKETIEAIKRILDLPKP